MPRKTKHLKPLIYVFCEGESEQVYTEYLKRKFKDVTVIKYPSAVGLFEEADARFKKDSKFRTKSGSFLILKQRLLKSGVRG